MEILERLQVGEPQSAREGSFSPVRSGGIACRSKSVHLPCAYRIPRNALARSRRSNRRVPESSGEPAWWRALLSAFSPAVVGCTTVMSLAVTLGAELCSANPARVARYWRWSHRDFGLEYRRSRPVSGRRNSPERIRLANRMVYVLCDAHAAGSNASGFNFDQHFKRSELES
jgi:hypothetical protein